MIHKFRLLCILLAPALSLQAQNHDLDLAVASELLRDATNPMAVNALQTNPDFLRRYTTGVLEQELAQEAARRGLTERLDVQQAMANARMRILIQALQQDVARKLPKATDAQIKQRFDANPENYRLLEAVQADLFLLDGSDPQAIQVARSSVAARDINPEELQSTRFQHIALAAQDTWVPKTSFPEEVWNGITELNEGQVRFYRVEDNILLVRFHAHREESAATLEDVHELIRQEINNERMQTAWNAFLDRKRADLGLTLQ